MVGDTPKHHHILSALLLVAASFTSVLADDGGKSFSESKSEASKPGILVPPLLSLMLPGADQWYEGDYAAATAFSGAALLGYTYMGSNSKGLSEKKINKGIYQTNVQARKYFLGELLAQDSGLLSAYYSFHEAALTRKQFGEFAFLKSDEKMHDILMAPFQFGYLLRPTTFIALSVRAAVVSVGARLLKYDLGNPRRATNDDLAFSGSYSYLASTSEEAMFRGWLMPVFMHYSDSTLVSNTIQAGLFGVAHYQPGTIAGIPQALDAFYDGWLTQYNGWAISECVFQHFWYDFILLVTAYGGLRDADLIRPIIFPPIQFVF